MANELPASPKRRLAENLRPENTTNRFDVRRMGAAAFKAGREIYTNPFTGLRAGFWRDGWRQAEATEDPGP